MEIKRMRRIQSQLDLLRFKTKMYMTELDERLGSNDLITESVECAYEDLSDAIHNLNKKIEKAQNEH